MAEVDRLVTVASFYTAPEAHLAMGELKAAGVDCCIADENIASSWGHVQATGGVKVQVRLTDVERALAVLGGDDDDDAGD